MKVKITAAQKLILLSAFLMASIYGFMIKLPSGFRHIDKDLHAPFYFLAAAFLNILFSKGKLIWHILIFGSLYAFGFCIEHAQEYSNKYFRKKIHGRFDPEDVKNNLKGLLFFSAIWLLIVFVIYLKNNLTTKNNVDTKEL